MSHAVVQVAIDGGLKRHHLEKALALQMKPFDEGNTCFRDGSRWDWYEVGGRWNGFYCGKNIVRRGDLDLEEMKAKQKRELEDCYAKAMEAVKKDRESEWYRNWKPTPERPDETAEERLQNNIEFIYDVKLDETLEAFLERRMGGVSASYAFLRNFAWHEGERMGWWAMPIKAECELRHGKKGRCIFRRTWYRHQVKIVCWDESWDVWRAMFFDRFIKGLPEDEWLIAVDFHV